DRLLSEHQDVERIAVQAIRLWQEAVVRGVVDRTVQDPVDPQEARGLVELVLHLRALRNLDDGPEAGLDGVHQLDVVPGVYHIRSSAARAPAGWRQPLTAPAVRPAT